MSRTQDFEYPQGSLGLSMNDKHLNKALSTFLSRSPPKKQARQLGSAPSAPVSSARSPARSSSRHRGTQGVRGRSYPIPTYKIPPPGTDTTRSGQGHRQRGRHSSDSECSDDQGRRDHSRRPRASSTSSDSGTSARGSASSGQSPATPHRRRHRAPRRSQTQAEPRRKDDTSFFSRHTLGISFLAGAVAGVGVSAALRTDKGRKVREALTRRVRSSSAAPPLTRLSSSSGYSPSRHRFRYSSPRGRSRHSPSPHWRDTSTSDRFGTRSYITSSESNYDSVVRHVGREGSGWHNDSRSPVRRRDSRDTAYESDDKYVKYVEYGDDPPSSGLQLVGKTSRGRSASMARRKPRISWR